MPRRDPAFSPSPDPANLSWHEWTEAEAAAERLERPVLFARSLTDQACRRPVTLNGRTSAPQTRSLTRRQAMEWAELIAERARLVVEEWRRCSVPVESQLLSTALISLSRTLLNAAGDAPSPSDNDGVDVS